MRAMLENASTPDNAAVILKSIKEALRIALEEENEEELNGLIDDAYDAEEEGGY